MKVEIHKTLDHPNIIKLYEVIEAPAHGYTCLVLELVDGVDLLDHVLDQPGQRLTVSTSVKMFSQLLSAVDYLHSKGVSVCPKSSTIIQTDVYTAQRSQVGEHHDRQEQ